MSDQPAFPQLRTALVNPDGSVTIPWYYFFIALWQKTGGSSGIANSVFLALANGFINAIIGGSRYATLVIGALQTNNTIEVSTPISGGVASNVVVGPSPWTYIATFQGTLAVSSGQVTLARGNVANVVSLTGGAIPVLVGDIITVTYYDQAPIVVFFPG